MGSFIHIPLHGNTNLNRKTPSLHLWLEMTLLYPLSA